MKLKLLKPCRMFEMDSPAGSVVEVGAVDGKWLKQIGLAEDCDATAAEPAEVTTPSEVPEVPDVPEDSPVEIEPASLEA